MKCKVLPNHDVLDVPILDAREDYLNPYLKRLLGILMFEPCDDFSNESGLYFVQDAETGRLVKLHSWMDRCTFQKRHRSNYHDPFRTPLLEIRRQRRAMTSAGKVTRFLKPRDSILRNLLRVILKLEMVELHRIHMPSLSKSPDLQIQAASQ
jgi:hypothetical protein